jgi:uncharacterized membrane protein YciS (DUF1049 family)
MININFILKTSDFSLSVLVKWILSVCLDIHALRLSYFSNDCHNEIARLKKLKKLEIWAEKASQLNKVKLIASELRQRCSLPRRFSGAVARWKYFG